MTDKNIDELWIDVSDAVIRKAERLASARLTEARRRLSPDRPTSRNSISQIRGAVGELVVADWLRSLKFVLSEGFLDDKAHDSDINVKGISIEVMTAKIEDRIRTGFCVPPNKWEAASRRNAWGYVFVGTNSDSPPRRVLLQGVAELSDIALNPPKFTFVNNPDLAIENYIVEPRCLKSPSYLVQVLSGTAKE